MQYCDAHTQSSRPQQPSALRFFDEEKKETKKYKIFACMQVECTCTHVCVYIHTYANTNTFAAIWKLILANQTRATIKDPNAAVPSWYERSLHGKGTCVTLHVCACRSVSENVKQVLYVPLCTEQKIPFTSAPDVCLIHACTCMHTFMGGRL